jgi:DNA polymerase
MREWVLERVGDEAKKLMWTGEKYSIDKSVRANLLAMDDPVEIPTHVADVIQCADDLWASSVAKFARLANLADDEDHRVRGAFVFAGGAATGRTSSYGAQVHNFTRKCAKEPDAVRQAMVRGHAITPKFGKRITDVLKGMLRPALIAKPGHVLIAYDWSAIEGRMHPWLSNCPAGEQKLDVFRSGLDPYKVNAAATFRVAYDDVTGDQRQVGKVQELALGFLGGAGAFEVFGRAYGIRLSAGEVQRAVDGWRRANPWAQAHGQQLESAYLRAMRNKNHEFKAGRIVYLFDGQTLWYALPSGRVLCYPNAKFDDEGNVTYTKAAWKPAADAKEWPRARLWRGLACENVTQAAAHDILRHSLRQLDGVVLHVHDEIVVECPAHEAEAVAAHVHTIMCTPPAWAEGLPLAAEGTTTARYS